MQRKVLAIVLFSVCITGSYAQNSRSHWVDSVFKTLDQEARIGQLFMVPVSSYESPEAIDQLVETINDFGVGGITITGGGPIRHARLVNLLQKKSKIPLLVGISAEWGLAQTLDSVTSFHKPMIASSWKDDSLVTVWATEIAKQMKLMGVNINFAPNADDEVSAGDYARYFSNDESRVTARALAFTKALQSNGILTVAKHLPRKLPATTSVQDSTLVLHFDQIDTVGLMAFEKLIQSGVDGILTNYLHFSLQNEKEIIPASMSRIFIPEILRGKMKFNGLVFADVTHYNKLKMKSGEAELLGFETGNDILLNPQHLNVAVKKILKRIKKDKFLQQQLEASVKKILEAKYNAGLNQTIPVNTDNLLRKLQSPEVRQIHHRLAEAAVTLVKNDANFLPIDILETRTFECISIGKPKENEFTHMLKKYVALETASLFGMKDTVNIDVKGKVIILGIFQYAADLERQLTPWINRLATSEKVILVHFGNPSSLDNFKNTTASIAAYTDQDEMTVVVPQVIFGALRAQGVLPVNIAAMKNGESLTTTAIDRFAYTVPEEAGLDSRTLEKIKGIMNEAIDQGATPGCHVLIAKDGKVIYEQSAGTLTYDKSIPVTDETIYDLASVTKVSATLQTTMFMVEHGLIDLNKKASFYLPELKESNKKDLILKDILTHQAGLWPTVFFWTRTLDNSRHLPEYYNTEESVDYPYPVSGNIFAVKSIKDSLWKWTIESKMREKPPRTPYDFRYSDVGSYILKELADKILNQPMEDFLEQNLYEPLGANTIGYLPLTRFPVTRIAPTEYDTIFRKTLLVGYVHDQGAAMNGGIAGHAGLFGDANDLAKLGQLWLQKGHYGGVRYFKPETIDLFSSKQYEGSRRALGWDRSPGSSEWVNPTSVYASAKTFGHTGFTGTCIWVDPEFKLVYVFLSNRVNPDMNNNKLSSLNIRPRIHDVIYQAMFDYCSHKN